MKPTMKPTMKHTMIAMFTDQAHAREAQQALLAAGFASAGLHGGGAGANAPGHYLLTLITTSSGQIGRAAEIVARHGPVAIDEAERQRLLAGDYFTERR